MTEFNDADRTDGYYDMVAPGRPVSSLTADELCDRCDALLCDSDEPIVRIRLHLSIPDHAAWLVGEVERMLLEAKAEDKPAAARLVHRLLGRLETAADRMEDCIHARRAGEWRSARGDEDSMQEHLGLAREVALTP